MYYNSVYVREKGTMVLGNEKIAVVECCRMRIKRVQFNFDSMTHKQTDVMLPRAQCVCSLSTAVEVNPGN